MSDPIDRQAAIDALDVLCQEHRYKIPGKVETYSQYNEAWQDALDRAEGAIGNLPSVQPERKVGHWVPIDDEPHEDYECDVCGFISEATFCPSGIGNFYNYCPICGARMKEVPNDGMA